MLTAVLALQHKVSCCSHMTCKITRTLRNYRRYYRRLLQMGVTNSELWNNVGLCCFYASQYDTCLSCFDKALQLADDSALPDVWYNIGQVGDGSIIQVS